MWPFTIVDSFTVFTISAITISPIHCPHTYTVSLSVVVKDSFICYVPHTHTHMHVFAGVIVLSAWDRRHYNSIGFQDYICPSPVCAAPVTTARSHTYTQGSEKKIIFHACEISSNGCLGDVCSYRKWFQYDVTLNCPSNTLLININKL